MLGKPGREGRREGGSNEGQQKIQAVKAQCQEFPKEQELGLWLILRGGTWPRRLEPPLRGGGISWDIYEDSGPSSSLV